MSPSTPPPTRPQEGTYWEERYALGETGWDVGQVARPLKEYIDQLQDTSLRILVPGAGNAYEAEYLWHRGFQNVFVVDIAAAPLENFARRVPAFPKEQLLHQDFFAVVDQFDLILEQTFFCSFYPSTDNRSRYAEQMYRLLKPGGKLVGLWFCFPLDSERGRPPYGGSRAEYLTYFRPWLVQRSFELCYNSIQERSGTELFGIWQKALL